MPTTKARNLAYRLRLAVPFGIPRLDRHPAVTAVGSRLYTYDDCVRLLRKHHVLGSAIMLKSDQGKVTVLSSSASPEHIVSDRSMFRVASITKMATALCAMTAAEQGKLSPDAPVKTVFQNIPGASSLPDLDGITLTHLLSHTSGLQDPPGLESALNDGLPFTDILPGCRKEPPGAVFRYSNLGFGLIGSLLEAVYQEPVSVVFDRLVFRPLDMRATLSAVTLDPASIVPITRIYRYHPGRDLIMTPLGSRPLTEADPLRHYGYTAGAMYLDLPSLEKLTDCLARNGAPLISAGSGAKMAEKHAEYGKVSPTLSYGLGLLRIQDPSVSGRLILGHQGFAYGCVDGAFWEEGTHRMILSLNGGASEARTGRLGLLNRDLLCWALKKEMPLWRKEQTR